MKKAFRKIMFDFFYLLIGAFISFMILEKLKPGLVSNYFDINKLLYIIIPIGIICVLIGATTNKEQKK